MIQDWQYWPVIRPIIRLLSSSKAVALVLAALAADFGLDLSPEMTALIYALAAVIYAATTAVEDAAQKRS